LSRSPGIQAETSKHCLRVFAGRSAGKLEKISHSCKTSGYSRKCSGIPGQKTLKATAFDLSTKTGYKQFSGGCIKNERFFISTAKSLPRIINWRSCLGPIRSVEIQAVWRYLHVPRQQRVFNTSVRKGLKKTAPAFFNFGLLRRPAPCAPKIRGVHIHIRGGLQAAPNGRGTLNAGNGFMSKRARTTCK